jgi:hypothetical protein
MMEQLNEIVLRRINSGLASFARSRAGASTPR